MNMLIERSGQFFGAYDQCLVNCFKIEYSSLNNSCCDFRNSRLCYVSSFFIFIRFNE